MSAPQQIVEVDVITMKRPDDASGLEELFRNGREPSDVVAIVGKTDGTGLGKDPAREATDLAVKRVLSARLGIPVDAVHDRVCIVLSGGSPGLITPHIAVFSRRLVAAHTEAASDRLVLGLTHSEPIAPHEVGRLAQVRKVEEAVRKAVKDAGTDAASVHAVLVKAPALTEQGIREANAAGHDTVTRDLSIGPEGALCYSNDASALGVAVALGEVARGDVTSEAIRADFSLFSNVAITSSGGEKTRAEVMVIANGPSGAGPLRSGHSPMHDVLDVDALGRAMTDAGLTDEARTQGAGLTYLLMKMIVPGDRIVLGEPITWHDDPAAYHVAKAMGGYAMAFATGSTRGFVSGGEQNSHQGPPGGNPVAAIVRLAGGASDTVLRRD